MAAISAAALGAFVLAACTTTVHGSGQAMGRPGSGGFPVPSSAPASQTSGGVPSSSTPAGLPRYQPLPNNAGYSLQPFDQPQPLPDTQSLIGCDYLAAFRSGVAALHPTGTAVASSGCQLRFAGGEVAQIRATGPYSMVNDITSYLKGATVAGLEARYYSFVSQATSTICAVEVNTRSLYDLAVDGYNLNDHGGNFQKHCQLAGAVANALLKTYVPLAGGRPYSPTPQQPSAATLRNATACKIVNAGAVIYANDLADQNPKAGRSAQGETCDYSSPSSGTVHVLFTTSTGGLAAVPPRSGTVATSTKDGVLPARTEQTANACTFSVQFRTGQVAQLTYTLSPTLTSPFYHAATCLAAQATMSASLMGLMASQ
jgi:hypothetical protein